MSKVSLLSIVVSVYNEESVLEAFWVEIRQYLDKLADYEIIFVNDGSTDRSKDFLVNLANNNRKIKIIHLSKNFGHEAAMMAGIDYSKGDAIICMDADLQHPPSMIRDIISKFEEGYDVINMVRRESHDAALVKKITSYLFYRIINILSIIRFEPNASDFFAISRRVADIIRDNFQERTRFLRGFIQTIGFKKTAIEFISAKRLAGKTKYSLFTLFAFSISAIMIFSNIPLRLGMLFGSIVGLLSVIVGVYSIIMKLLGYVIPGYTTIVVLISFLLAVQFFILGIMGEYIGVIFNEIKKRPIYLVEDEINITKMTNETQSLNNK